MAAGSHAEAGVFTGPGVLEEAEDSDEEVLVPAIGTVKRAGAGLGRQGSELPSMASGVAATREAKLEE